MSKTKLSHDSWITALSRPEVRPISVALNTLDKSRLPSTPLHGRQSIPVPMDLWPEAEIDQLLNNLVQSRWSRLACQDADPLGMLFNDRAKQWTVGWEPNQQALLLLVWETDSWQNKPCWSLYRNGTLIFQISDASFQRQQWLAQLLESPNLPTLTPTELVARIADYRFSEGDRQQAAEQLRLTATMCPDLAETVQAALLNLLETDLGNTEWPTLEVLKLHRVAHKNGIIRLFQDWLKRGLVKDNAHTGRLSRTLNQLKQDYFTLGQNLNPLFQAKYQEAYQDFRDLFTQCLWQIQIQQAFKKVPAAAARRPATCPDFHLDL